ncbi:MAG: CmcJ/NvfI family oxidoreductase, partial [Steroidobacteraceae bacterium]
MVEASVSYITPSGRKPFAYEYDPPAGTPRGSHAYREHLVRIRNARSLDPAASLDKQGFALREHATRVKDFYDAAEVREAYYAELERLIKEATAASSVLVFDHTVRGNAVASRSGTEIHEAVSRVHNDYTAQSALRRVRDVVPAGDAD